MEIEDVKAHPGEAVWVENWRKKQPVKESGKLVEATYKYSSSDQGWSYYVLLDRKNPKGQAMVIDVNQEQIERL